MKCVDCGKKQGLFESWYGERCVDCHLEWKLENDTEFAEQAEEFEQRIADEEQLKSEIDKVLVTTETVTNFNISNRIDVITSQAAFEINNFKDIVVGFMNPVKGRANEMEKQIDTLKDKAMYDLKAKAHQLNANGVVGVDLDISTVTIGQISMLMLVASGTAVVIED